MRRANVRSVAVAQLTVYERLHQWPQIRPLFLEVAGERVVDAFGRVELENNGKM